MCPLPAGVHDLSVAAASGMLPPMAQPPRRKSSDDIAPAASRTGRPAEIGNAFTSVNNLLARFTSEATRVARDIGTEGEARTTRPRMIEADFLIDTNKSYMPIF